MANNERDSLLFWVPLGVAAVVAIQIVYALVLWHHFPSPLNRGLFGDAFEGLNTL